jgi:hypothetical protein
MFKSTFTRTRRPHVRPQLAVTALDERIVPSNSPTTVAALPAELVGRFDLPDDGPKVEVSASLRHGRPKFVPTTAAVSEVTDVFKAKTIREKFDNPGDARVTKDTEESIKTDAGPVSTPAEVPSSSPLNHGRPKPAADPNSNIDSSPLRELSRNIRFLENVGELPDWFESLERTEPIKLVDDLAAYQDAVDLTDLSRAVRFLEKINELPVRFGGPDSNKLPDDAWRGSVEYFRAFVDKYVGAV